MTRDDILRMAEESGLAEVLSKYDSEYGHDNSEETEGFLEFARFAALVAAEVEREMTKNGWRKCAEGQSTTQYCAVAEAALRYRDET